MESRRVLVVGAGRMGQRYLSVLPQLFKTEMVTVDPVSRPSNVALHFSSLDHVPKDMKFHLAVDARPNFERFKTLQDLIERQIPYIIVEKPHSESIAESEQMMNLAAKSQSKIMLPFFRRFFGVDNASLKSFEAGQLISVNVTAGAIGWGCNGVHLLDWVFQLFGHEPLNVWGSLDEVTIPSPRGERFKDLGGVITLQFPRGRAVLNLMSESAVGIQSVLAFEKGKIIIREDVAPHWDWFRFSAEDMNLPPYRTSLETMVEPPFPYAPNLINAMKVGINRFLEGEEVAGLEDGHRSLKVIALASKASKKGVVMDWKDNSSIADCQFQFT